MESDLTFKSVCDFLKKDDPTLIDSIDKLAGITIVLTPIVFGPAALPALALLRAKDEITRLGRALYDKVTSKRERNYLERTERMKAAYGLICYTAFFEALDKTLPKELRAKLDIDANDRLAIAKEPNNCAIQQESELKKPIGTVDATVQFPHPVISPIEQEEELKQLYRRLATGFGDFLNKLSISDEKNKTLEETIKKLIEVLPSIAFRHYQSQYLHLATQFHEFYVWARFEDARVSKANLSKVSDYVKNYEELISAKVDKLDISLNQLQQTVLSIPEKFAQIEAFEIVDALALHYEARINETIIEDEYRPHKDKPSLSFPKVSEAFIPQAYKVLRHTTKERHLENEEIWQPLERRNDLGAFLVSYLSSPYSTEAPLLILGHPGSGKSLLSKVLCARLMSESYTPIRIPLREVDAEQPFEILIVDEIRHATKQQINSWPHFSSQFHERPLVIILDGYDELLQASGQVFSAYMKKVQQFQNSEAEQKRSIRFIVTSRVTLIDKASVPLGSTVVRLLEFDAEQCDKWIDIWNQKNSSYFSEGTPVVRPFELPEDKRILELAEQPLLLLMLAIYDAKENGLRSEKRLDRTRLYDSLLRRFVVREREKDTAFLDKLTQAQRDIEVDWEMKRLGVAALGMYNRSKLHILAMELERDLKFFHLERIVSITSGRPMSQADMLVGGFFFIHKSRTTRNEHGDELNEHLAAFEFLHNTFGEFLAADFVLRKAFEAVETLILLKEEEYRARDLYRKFHGPDGLSSSWYACLMYSPLYSRPEVLEMIREWFGHLLLERRLLRETFIASLDELVHGQIAMILNSRQLPIHMQNEGHDRFVEMPLLGHVAVYSMNLIILRTILNSDEFIFDEAKYSSAGDGHHYESSGARPWDKLAHLWRAWFTLDNLNGLTAILQAKRNGTLIRIVARQTFQTSPSEHRLDTVINVATALADNITSGLAGLLAGETTGKRRVTPSDLGDALESENINLSLEVIVRQLRHAMWGKQISSTEIMEMIGCGFDQLHDKRQRAELVSEFIRLIEQIINSGALDIPAHRLLSHYVRPDAEFENAGWGPELFVEWMQVIRGSSIDILRNSEMTLHDRVVGDTKFIEIAESRPIIFVEWLRILGAARNRRLFSKYADNIRESLHRLSEDDRIRSMYPLLYLEISLCLRNSPLSQEWVKLHGRSILERFEETSEFEPLSAVRPDLSLELLRLDLDTSDSKRKQKESRRVLKRYLLHPIFIQIVERHKPELLAELVYLVSEVSSLKLIRLEDEDLSRFWTVIKANWQCFPLSSMKPLKEVAGLLNSPVDGIGVENEIERGE